MEIADFIESSVCEFTFRDPVLTSEDQLVESINDYKSLVYEKRELKGPIATMCWFTSREGILFIRRDTSDDRRSYQSKFHIVASTSTFFHTHDFVELAYVARGSLNQRICDHEETFLEGEFCLIDRESLHNDSLKCDDSVILFLSIENSYFSRSFARPNHSFRNDVQDFYRELILQRKEKYKYIRFVPKADQTQDAPDLLMKVLAELWEKRPGAEMLVQGYVERLLAFLPTQYDFSLSKQEQNQLRKALFDDIDRYLHENYQTACIESLQSRFHYNADYFNRLIRQFANVTYSKYLQNIRLEKAFELICETSRTIENIAFQVGYANLGYFYKIFEEKYGKKPGRFRA